MKHKGSTIEFMLTFVLVLLLALVGTTGAQDPEPIPSIPEGQDGEMTAQGAGDNPLTTSFSFTGRVGLSINVIPFSMEPSPGTFNISGIPVTATIKKALMYVQRWNSPLTNASATLAGNTLGPLPAFSSDLLNGFNLQAYRFDVTTIVNGNGSYPFTFNTGGGQNYYAALIVVFSDASLPSRRIHINDGSEGLGSYRNPTSTTSTTTYSDLEEGPGTLTIVTQADENTGIVESLDFNGATILGPGNIFNANLGPVASLFQLPVSVMAGTNTASISTDGLDVFGWHLAILESPEEPPEPPLSDEQYRVLSTWLFGHERTVTGRWGVEPWPVTGRHTGVDYGAPQGTELLAATDGEVIRVARGSPCQQLECLSTLAIYNAATDTTFLYLHMEIITVEVGMQVSAGDVLGTVGQRGPATAPHLHLEARAGRRTHAALSYENTVNPYQAAEAARNAGYEPPQFLTLPFIDPDIMVGWIFDPDSSPPHYGIDFIKDWQSFAVVAAADGVAMQSNSVTYGVFVLIRHSEKDNTGNNYFTLYAHLDSVASEIPLKDKYDTNYSSWKSVEQGELIGIAGNTGASWTGIHLHFEVQRKAYAQYKTDPYDLNQDRNSHYGEKANSIDCGPNHLWSIDPPTTADGKVAEVLSPVELRVYDSQGRITGLWDGEEMNEIPNSTYFENSVTIALPADTYYYEVAGTGEGTYGLNITSVSEGEAVTFEAIDIPTSPDAVHRYTIDWDALSAGEEGVRLEIDNNGDGFFEQIVIADNELTYDEFALQAKTAIDFEPDTLNLESEGKFVTVYIELPEGFDVSEIDISSLTLNESVAALPKPVETGDYDSDGINDLMVKFDRQELIEVLEPGEQIIDLTGQLSDGRRLAGFDIIRVIH